MNFYYEPGQSFVSRFARGSSPNDLVRALRDAFFEQFNGVADQAAFYFDDEHPVVELGVVTYHVYVLTDRARAESRLILTLAHSAEDDVDLSWFWGCGVQAHLAATARLDGAQEDHEQFVTVARELQPAWPAELEAWTRR